MAEWNVAIINNKIINHGVESFPQTVKDEIKDKMWLYGCCILCEKSSSHDVVFFF